MSINIHQLIIKPGNDVKFVCDDGLSLADVMNIKRIYRFGGSVNFINCGIEYEFALLF